MTVDESSKPDRARTQCFKGWHDDQDNSGMCIYCAIILDSDHTEDPNSYRRANGWPDVPLDAPSVTPASVDDNELKEEKTGDNSKSGQQA